MSMEMNTERVCYVHCNFCNTILAVNVPWGMFTIVAVRCGHCANLLSVNMGGSLHSLHEQDFQLRKQTSTIEASIKENPSSSKGNKLTKAQLEPPRMPPPIRPPEKRQRVPSAYNRFIKEEIQRIKAGNPEISHREAFSTAAKNWAHFPHIQFGLNLDGNKHAKLDNHSVAGEAAPAATQKASGV